METVPLLLVSNSRVSRVWENGREYLIAPATSLREQVLAGSQGALFYPAEETARSAASWDRQPLVLYHPTYQGTDISAHDSRADPSSVLGDVRSSQHVGNGKLQHQLWFDVEATRNADRKLHSSVKILPRLLAGKPVALSTGLYTDNQPAESGSHHNGTPYTAVARNYRPDHIAILPDVRAACDIQDGCGVLVNAFCPTGEGGGHDNSCGKGDSSRLVKSGQADRASLAAKEASDKLGEDGDARHLSAYGASGSAVSYGGKLLSEPAADAHRAASSIHAEIASQTSVPSLKKSHEEAAKLHAEAAAEHSKALTVDDALHALRSQASSSKLSDEAIALSNDALLDDSRTAHAAAAQAHKEAEAGAKGTAKLAHRAAKKAHLELSKTASYNASTMPVARAGGDEDECSCGGKCDECQVKDIIRNASSDSLAKLQGVLDEYTDEQLDGLAVSANPDLGLCIVDRMDWYDKSADGADPASEVEKLAAKLWGENRVVSQNEGPIPKGDGWIRLNAADGQPRCTDRGVYQSPASGSDRGAVGHHARKGHGTLDDERIDRTASATFALNEYLLTNAELGHGSRFASDEERVAAFASLVSGDDSITDNEFESEDQQRAFFGLLKQAKAGDGKPPEGVKVAGGDRALKEAADAKSAEAVKRSGIAKKVNRDRQAREHGKAAEAHREAAEAHEGLGDRDRAEGHRKIAAEHESRSRALAGNALTPLQSQLLLIYNRNWPAGKRDELPHKDFAGPGQSFPITTQTDVDAAARLIGKASDPEAVKSRIKAIAKRKGLDLPASWTTEETNDVATGSTVNASKFGCERDCSGDEDEEGCVEECMTENGFCATGKGGGADNSCGSKGAAAKGATKEAHEATTRAARADKTSSRRSTSTISTSADAGASANTALASASSGRADRAMAAHEQAAKYHDAAAAEHESRFGSGENDEAVQAHRQAASAHRKALGYHRSATRNSAGDHEDHEATRSHHMIGNQARKIIVNWCNQHGGDTCKGGSASAVKHATKLSAKANALSERAAKSGDLGDHVEAERAHDDAVKAHMKNGSGKEAHAHAIQSLHHRQEADAQSVSLDDHSSPVHLEEDNSSPVHIPGPGFDDLKRAGKRLRNSRGTAMPLDREETLAKLTANCKCSEDLAVINELSDETLATLVHNAASQYVRNAPESDPEAFEDDDGDAEDDLEKKEELTAEGVPPGEEGPTMPMRGKGGKKMPPGMNRREEASMTYNEWLAMAPPEAQETHRWAAGIVAREKRVIVNQLVSHVADKGRKKLLANSLMDKSMEELVERLEMLPPPATNQRGGNGGPRMTGVPSQNMVSYLGAAGGPATNQLTLTDNEANDILDIESARQRYDPAVINRKSRHESTADAS